MLLELVLRSEPADFVPVLAELEALQVAARYTEANTPHDSEPLGDPPGRAAVAASCQALTGELADDEWERLVAEWRVD